MGTRCRGVSWGERSEHFVALSDRRSQGVDEVGRDELLERDVEHQTQGDECLNSSREFPRTLVLPN